MAASAKLFDRAMNVVSTLLDDVRMVFAMEIAVSTRVAPSSRVIHHPSFLRIVSGDLDIEGYFRLSSGKGHHEPEQHDEGQDKFERRSAQVLALVLPYLYGTSARAKTLNG